MRFEISFDYYVYNEYWDLVLILFMIWIVIKDNYVWWNIIVENWVMLKLFVVFLFFIIDEDLWERVEIKGWKIFFILKIGIGILVLKDMYIVMMSKF